VLTPVSRDDAQAMLALGVTLPLSWLLLCPVTVIHW
jgi:hypothetical protein